MVRRMSRAKSREGGHERTSPQRITAILYIWGFNPGAQVGAT